MKKFQLTRREGQGFYVDDAFVRVVHVRPNARNVKLDVTGAGSVVREELATSAPMVNTAWGRFPLGWWYEEEH